MIHDLSTDKDYEVIKTEQVAAMQFASTEKYAGDEEDQERGTNLKRPPLREGPNSIITMSYVQVGACRINYLLLY